MRLIAVGVSAAGVVGCNSTQGGFREAEFITEWVDTFTLTGCDNAYRVREVAWEDSPGGGWPAPSVAIDELGEIEIEVLWASDSINPAPELNGSAAAWLGPLTRWGLQFGPHAQRLPLLAENARSPDGCPDLLVVPLGVRLESSDNQLYVEDLGGRVDRSWAGSSFPPWAAVEISALVLIGGQQRLGLNVVPGMEDRFEWSESFAAHAEQNLPEGYTMGLIRVQAGGGVEAGTFALSSTFHEKGGNSTISWGLGGGHYEVIEAPR